QSVARATGRHADDLRRHFKGEKASRLQSDDAAERGPAEIHRLAPENPALGVQLANRLHRRHNCPQMSGMFFENPGVRFSRRLSLFHFRMRFVASRLFRRLTGADSRCSRMDSRYDEAEFPATQTAHELFFLGSRARDCASTDALRPFNNWVKPEDQYGISIIG